VIEMSKASVTRLFIGAALVVVAGFVIGVAALGAALLGGAITIGGPNVVSVDGGAFAGMVVWLVVASVVIAGGTVAAIASWIGALLNTAQLEDKTWFVVLLVLGLFSFGWLGMIAYVVAGPDGSQRAEAGAAGIQATFSS
jgi:hypothetical protein